MFESSRTASRRLLTLSDAERSAVILTLADLIDGNVDSLIEANLRDLERMDPESPLCDRLRLTPGRIADIASSLREVAALPSPVDETVEERRLPNGLELRKVRVPFGVIGVIYEARPNVTFDVFALCLKSGNACILKGGS
ncbi:MAG: gamma-glutamyl-phosphate reductase, partial [Duncaniella sp.]|nr:gamma-glutamyl-phosphate reductase [Duncaniella sp.]